MRLNLDDSTVEKFVMPEEEYAKRNDSVLAWKKRQNLGRFNPEKEKKEAVELERSWADVEARRIVVGTRCRVGGADLDKRGTVRFVGEVKEIPNKGLWVGFEADEPTGTCALSAFVKSMRSPAGDCISDYSETFRYAAQSGLLTCPS